MAPLLPLLAVVLAVLLFGYCAYRWGLASARRLPSPTFRAGWASGYYRGWLACQQGRTKYTPWTTPIDEVHIVQDESEYNSTLTLYS